MPDIIKQTCYSSKQLSFLAAAIAGFALVCNAAGKDATGNSEKASSPSRPPWSTSRVVGTPDPPPPYTVEPAFTDIAWKNPVFAIREPDSEWLIVVEWPQPKPAAADSQQIVDNKAGSQSVIARAVRVLDREAGPYTQPFLELEDRAIHALVFHPRHRENWQVYICSKTQPQGGAVVNILSRFIVTHRAKDGKTSSGTPACDPSSETQILQWPSDGHDGGAVVFGHDGMLYVSTGDGTADSDDKLTAQDAGSLLGKILRIDVDRPAVYSSTWLKRWRTACQST